MALVSAYFGASRGQPLDVSKPGLIQCDNLFFHWGLFGLFVLLPFCLKFVCLSRNVATFTELNRNKKTYNFLFLLVKTPFEFNVKK